MIKLVRGYLIFLMVSGAIFEYLIGWTVNAGSENNSAVFMIYEIPIFIIIFVAGLGSRFSMTRSGVYLGIYCAYCIFSAICNDDSIVSALKYIRYPVYGYFFYVIGKSEIRGYLDSSLIEDLKKLLFLQVLVAGFYVFVLNLRDEWRVGTISVWGGEMATVFPLVTLPFVLGYYFFENRSLKIMLLSVAFCLVAYASGKRAIYGLFPILFVLTIFLSSKYLPKERIKLKSSSQVLQYVIFLMFVLPAAYFGISQSEYIGFDRSSGLRGSLENTWSAVIEYEFTVRDSGNSVGRSTTAINVISQTSNPLESRFYIGAGPSVVLKQGTDVEDLNVDYGLSGFTRDVVSLGWPAAVLFYCFLFVLISEYRRDSVNLARSEYATNRYVYFGIFGALVSQLFVDAYYTANFRTAPFPLLPLMYLAGIYSRITPESRRQFLVSN